MEYQKPEDEFANKFDTCHLAHSLGCWETFIISFVPFRPPTHKAGGRKGKIMTTKTEVYISRCCGYDAIYTDGADREMFVCLLCGCECSIIDPSDQEPNEN